MWIKSVPVTGTTEYGGSKSNVRRRRRRICESCQVFDVALQPDRSAQATSFKETAMVLLQHSRNGWCSDIHSVVLALKRAGKRTIAWEKEREKLKVKFLGWGITTCELRYPGVCWHDNALGFAHAKKRRFLKPHELGHVVLACTPCHDVLESLGAELMEAEVDSTILARKKNLKKNLALENSLMQLSSCCNAPNP